MTKNIDLHYLMKEIASLSGLPVRIYEDEKRIFYSSTATLIKDPIIPFLSEILQLKDNVCYFSTPSFHYYGVVNSDSLKIVIGPTGQTGYSDRELKELAFLSGVEKKDVEAFILGIRDIGSLPLEAVLEVLFTINHILNGEKLGLKDITISESIQEEIQTRIEEENAKYKLDYNAPAPFSHNTFSTEDYINNLITEGDTEGLKSFTASAPSIRPGKLAINQLRQRKNTFVVTATLSSRAAIKGGLSVEEAFSLSDSYIQKCELLNTPEQITNLQFHMIYDYTSRVHEIKALSDKRLSQRVLKYVKEHISERITADEISSALFFSRPYLSKEFKKESGMTLTDFILKEKTKEAKRLLKFSNKSITEIALYLSFSSASHFSRVFKSYEGCTPREYRERTKK